MNTHRSIDRNLAYVSLTLNRMNFYRRIQVVLIVFYWANKRALDILLRVFVVIDILILALN